MTKHIRVLSKPNIIKAATQFIAITLTSLLFNSYAIASKNTQSLDRIIAVVNDTIITQSELNQRIADIKKQMTANHIPLPEDEVMHKQIIDQLINKKVQLQFAEQSGNNVSDNDITKAIDEIAKNNKLSSAELYQKVQEQGLNKEEYRNNIREELILQRIQQQNVASKIIVTPQEVDAFMRSKAWLAFNTKEYHLEDILIALPETPSPKDIALAKKKGNAILAKIHGGMNFQEVAAADSNEGNALQGGDLGWRKLPEIPSAFATKLVDMKINSVLGPIQTPNGFHIVKLVGVRNINQPISAAEQRTQVQQLIFHRKFEENLQNWITKIRASAFINVHPEKE